MSSDRFDTLIDEFPEETAAVRRLVDLIGRALETPGRKEYSPNRLYDLLQPSNYRVLIQLLASASDKGLLQRSIRVSSASGMGGIGDFDSMLDIPNQMYDSRIGRVVDVTQDQLEMIYSIHQ
jgi:hypothetical protein